MQGIFLVWNRIACRKLNPKSIYTAYLYPCSSVEESQQPEGDDNEMLLICTEFVRHWGAK